MQASQGIKISVGRPGSEGFIPAQAEGKTLARVVVVTTVKAIADEAGEAHDKLP